MSWNIIDWLLHGDPAIRFQTYRDLLQSDKKILENERKKIPLKGWGAAFLKYQKEDGHWGKGFYQPKWTSTHYTLLDLRNLNIPKANEKIQKSIELVLAAKRGIFGGINLSVTIKASDVCLNGMILNYCSYFKGRDNRLNSIADFILQTQLKDGGWNCAYLKGAVHSSLHTTLSVLEGLTEFRFNGNTYRKKEVTAAEERGIEFMLNHYLFRSHRTKEIINPQFISLSYPSRWRYDILRALDYFQYAQIKYDERMREAIDIIKKKKNREGKWLLQSKHKGAVHFDMEKVGEPSRWNTLRALRVIKRLDH